MSYKNGGSRGSSKKRFISRSIILITQAVNQLERVYKYLESNNILNKDELDIFIKNVKTIQDAKENIKEIYSSKSFRENIFRDTFNKFKDEWKKNTRMYSSVSYIVLDENYNNIIGMGKDVIPLIFEDLEKTNDFWFTALIVLTGKNPVKKENIGYIEKMKEDWINFGKENGYIKSEGE